MSDAHAPIGPLLYAHRGAGREQPENSLEAFELALAAGADALELDVHMSRDGHVVVSHDSHGGRTAGIAREINACTLAELKAWDLAAGFSGRCSGHVHVPTLDELLAALPDARLNIDVKQAQPDMLPALLAVIARHAAQERVLLTSFSSATTRRIRKLGYGGPTGLGQAEAVYAAFAPDALFARARVRGVRLQIPVRYGPLALDRGALVHKMHARGLAVDYWVVNDSAQAERLLALGADGIVTDDPRAMAELFARSPYTSAWRRRHPTLSTV
jgi:glycerophosphoryl diester phosphodiesterase